MREITEPMIGDLAEAVLDVALKRPEYAAWVVWGFADGLGNRRHDKPDPVDSATEDQHQRKMDAWSAGWKAAEGPTIVSV